MQGTIKSVSLAGGFAVIALPNESQAEELKFNLSDYRGKRLSPGDKVEFKLYIPCIGTLSAKDVVRLENIFKPTPQQHQSRKYYGKPTRVKGSISNAISGSTAGMVLGSALGPVGAIIGGLIGAASGESRELSSPCLRCGGTGHVTAVSGSHIGYQCEQCLRFWKQRNKNNLRMSDLSRD